ncbi:MAG TPA: universal stress protein, partial [Chthoniobacterales bacterium]|nr:universal stress protein [Chthoniobacterales bacterium]
LYMRCKKILAPTDLSKLSLPAIRYALELGLEQDAEVMIYHVLSEDGDLFGKDSRLNPASALLPRQKELLHDFIKENFADMFDKVKIAQVVDAGIPYNKIVAAAAGGNADLIIMSTHGRTGIKQVMLGSVTAQVVAHADCPVLSIRPKAN